MIFVILISLFLFIVIFPSFWVKRIIEKYTEELPNLQGTGGELAQHLIQRFKLKASLESTETGDHYDPSSKTVRLSPQFMEGRSLSAVAIAAHEVGHAVQHHEGHSLLRLRTQLAQLALSAERAGSIAFVIMPIIALVTRSPGVGFAMLALGVVSMLLGVIVHLVTLPVEIDASFNKALPILEDGQYLNPEQLAIAKKILLAAALTYVAGALVSIVNVWRWLYLLRMR
ncbi:MAG: zinc metallopeptidase [Pseudomonadota bacterium]